MTETNPTPTEIHNHPAESRFGVLRALAVAAVASAPLAGCQLFGDDGPECFEPPDRAITGFAVTTVTGQEGTDGTINFCFLRASTDEWDCHDLDHGWSDDFESGDVDEFTFDVDPIPSGDLASIEIYAQMNFLDSSWDMAGITVEAILRDGSTVVLHEADDANVNLSDDEVYRSQACGTEE